MQRRKGLTAKQARFCTEYLKDLNASQAALRAGYSPHSARAIGQQLMAIPHVRAEIAELEQEQLMRVGITAEAVLEQIRRVAFFDVASIYEWVESKRRIENPNDFVGEQYKCGCAILNRSEESLAKGCGVHGPGTAITFPLTVIESKRFLKHPADWPSQARAALAGFDTVVRNLTAGDGLVDTVLKVKLNDRMQALDMLAKHLGLLVEKQEVNKTITVRWLPSEPPPAIESTADGAPTRFLEGEVATPGQPDRMGFAPGPPAGDDRTRPPVGGGFSDPVEGPSSAGNRSSTERFTPGEDELRAAIARSGLSLEKQKKMFPELALKDRT